MDADTGLVYAQQRYYDPIVGRFLSVDPVTADAGSGGNFNRYWYANNNPYRFTDPDGRFGVVGFVIGAAIDVGVQVFVDGKSLADVDVGDALVAGLASAVIPGLGNLAKVGGQSFKAISSAGKAIGKVSSKAANTVNRAEKNAAAIKRNVEKIESATADVGAAIATAGLLQVAKAVGKDVTPPLTAGDVIKEDDVEKN